MSFGIETTGVDLYRLLDGWLKEADDMSNGLDDSTRETLRECATDLVDLLPARGWAKVLCWNTSVTVP